MVLYAKIQICAQIYVELEIGLIDKIVINYSSMLLHI